VAKASVTEIIQNAGEVAGEERTLEILRTVAYLREIYLRSEIFRLRWSVSCTNHYTNPAAIHPRTSTRNESQGRHCSAYLSQLWSPVKSNHEPRRTSPPQYLYPGYRGFESLLLRSEITSFAG
jgi:hypothetical protein